MEKDLFINDQVLHINIGPIHTKKLLVLIGLILVSISGLPAATEAAGASLYLSPSSGNYTVGKNFTATVGVNTGGVAINAADGNLSFNSNLEVVSVSKSGSIFNLWVGEPNYSNTARTVSFSGGIPNPGFTGSGKIFSITFRAKNAGTGTVNFSSGTVLANDGKGTNILSGMGSGSYILGEAPPAVSLPSLPEITSSTHPDQDKWYQNKNPQFSWKLPTDIIGVSFVFNKEEKSSPDSVSDGVINSKSYENIEDGIWYFHLKFQNKNGWGSTSHYKVKIDTTPPNDFEIIVDNGGDVTNPHPIIIFKTSDASSGIDYYEIKIGQGEIIKTNEDSYKTPIQPPGKYTVIVKALDKAGNYNLAMTDLIIEAIETPVITDYSKILYLGDPFYLKGKSLAETDINIYIQKEGEEKVFKSTVRSDKNGNFVYEHDRLLWRGLYNVWVEAQDSRGAKSNPSKKINVSVGPCALIKIGSLTINYLFAVIILLILILILCVLFWRTWQKIKERRKKLKKEITEAEEALYKAFLVLKKEIEEQIAMLDSYPGLSPQEKRIYQELKNALKISEEFIEKEIKDIKEELEKKLFETKFFKRKERGP